MEKKPTVFRHQLHLTWSEIIMGIASILLGVVLLIWPGIASSALLYGIGVLFIVIGIVHVVRYFCAETPMAINTFDLALGLIWIAGGALVMILKNLLIALIPVLFGVVVLFAGIYKFQLTMDFRRMHASHWYLELVTSLLSIVLGALILLNPFSSAMLLMRIIGASFVLEGVLDMISKSLYEKTKDAFFVATNFTDAPKA